MTTRRLLSTLILAAGAALLTAQPSDEQRAERMRQMSIRAEERGLAEPFKGVTANGAIESNLFSVHSTGVSTGPVVAAAIDFLSALDDEKRSRTIKPVEDVEWRKWMNQSFYVRDGAGFDEMSEAQRQAAFGLFSTSLSARGLQLTRDIMRLNHTLGELNGDDFFAYNEWLYWITVMGEPSQTEPWGWQLDGHHVIINYFVLGDQVVMSPFFAGSEPVIAEGGKYEGTAILQGEQRAGLEMLLALSDEQRRQAVVEISKGGNNNVGEAFQDNVVLDYAGVEVSTFSEAQKKQLLALAELYIGNLRDAHAKVKMSEVEAHLDDTYFAWVGGETDESVYYYRIHSPVVLIEFDHQRPANLRHLYEPGEPNRQHIHTVVRTPNGNDYGKDLLRQHYEAHPHE